MQLCALREPHTLMGRLGAACKAGRESEDLRTSTQPCPQCPQLSALGLLRAPSPSRGGGLSTPTEVLPPYRQMRLQGICRRSSSLHESRLGSSFLLLPPPFLPFLSRKTCCQAQVWWQLQGGETFGPGMELCQPCLLGQLGLHSCHLRGHT